MACPECGATTDAGLSFCPKCGAALAIPAAGSTATTAAAARAPTPYDDGKRARRLRSAAIILVVLGLLGTSNAVLALVYPAEPTLETLQSAAGLGVSGTPGSLRLLIVDGDAPQAGLMVNVSAYGSSASEQVRTDANGVLDIPSLPAALSNVSTQYRGRVLILMVFSQAPFGADTAWDLATADPANPTLDSSSLIPVLRIVAGVLLAMSLIVAGGGFAALRRRARFLAMTGAIVGILLALLSSGSLLFFALSGAASVLALVWIVQGRRLFRAAPPSVRS